MDISTYNIHEGLSGIGKAIGLEVVHGMTDVRDVREFVSVNEALFSMCYDDHFGWYACPAIARSYTLKMILNGYIPAVCDFCISAQS